MKRPAPQIAILIAALIWTAAAPARALPRKEPWIELRTANFTLFSNAGEKTVRRVGEDLERLRDALSQLVPELALNSPSPTYIFVFKNEGSFKPYQRVYGGQVLKSGGYFLARQLANYVAVNSDQHGEERLVIYHEYLHYVLRNNYSSLPLWFHEGLAEYYSTFEVGKDEARIGLPIKEHVNWLRQNPMLPLASLFAIDERSRDYNETSRRGGFYAQSWALVHYLISGSPERRLQATESLRLAQAGTPPGQIFRRAFGTDSAALERELAKYVKSYLFASTRVPIRAEANLEMESRPMAWPDVLFRLGDLLASMGSEQANAASEHFRAALAERPDHGPALAGLGYLEELAGGAAAAQPWYEKAAKMAPDDFFVQYRFAVSLLEEPGPEDSLERARAALTKAVRLRPDIGEAWARLGYTYQARNELPPEALEAMETAHRLLPSRMDVAHNLAIAYARTGQKEKAEALIENVLVPRAEPEMIANAREALVDEDYARAEELVSRGDLDAALPILEQVRERTSLSSRKTDVTARITEIREAQSFNRFVDGYNQAVELANRGDVRGAIAILEPLIETTRDPTQVERARSLVQRLRGPAKKRPGARPR